MKRIRDRLATHGVDAAVISSLPDIRWGCGFTGSNALLVVLPDAAHLVTDGRYAEQAAREVRGAGAHVAQGSLWNAVVEQGLLRSMRSVLFQADHVSYAEYVRWREALPSIAWKPVSDFLVDLVAVKSEDEIAAMRRAQRITDEVFTQVLGVLSPGMTEREVAAEIVDQHLRRGAQRMSFEPIVASGPNAALPHARPTDRRLSPGDAVVLDFGCVVDGYACDMTRTVFIGPPSGEQRRVYEVVLRAQEAAIVQARGGCSSRDLDAVARSIIAEEGYGAYFTHSLGHGIGLQTHEWPRVSHQVDYALPVNAVVTIEPGVYVPGRFGVRIEDMVVLREHGAENLTGASKALCVL